MLTVKQLKEFIEDLEDLDDSVEVRIASIYDSENEQGYHTETFDISYSSDSEGSFLILEPKEIELT